MNSSIPYIWSFLSTILCSWKGEEMVGTQPGIEHTAGPGPGDRLLLAAMLDSKATPWHLSAAHPSGNGKLLHPHLWCVGIHNTCYSSAMTTCCPNTWAGVEGHPLGDPGTAAFESFPSWAHRWHLVICSELPDLFHSLLHPSSKPWPPYPEPVEPKRKKVLSGNTQLHGAQS